jgi:hypothetical protein
LDFEAVVGGYVALADAVPLTAGRRDGVMLSDGIALPEMVLTVDLSKFSSVRMYGVGQTEPPFSTREVDRLARSWRDWGLALGELAGAAALAARQHRPGARAYTAARDQYRRAMIINELAHARLRAAESSADTAAQALAVRQERKAECARLALATGWMRAGQHSQNGDPLLGRVEIPPISITRP